MDTRKLAVALALSGALAISAMPVAFAQTIATDAGKGDDGKGKGPDLPDSGPGAIIAGGAVAAAVGFTLYRGMRAKGFTR